MSKYFFKDKHVIGLEISHTSAKVMSIRPADHIVQGYGAVELDPSKMTNVTDMSAHLTEQLESLFKKNIIGRLPSNHAIVSVPTSRTFTRSVTLPASAEDNLASAVEIEAEQYIPVAMNELYVDYEVIEKNKAKDTLEVLISAVPRLHADTVVKVCESLSIKPLLIEPSISSVARLVRASEAGELPTIILDVGAEGTDIAVLDKTIRVTGGINIGGNVMTDAIMRELRVSRDAAHMLRTHNGLSVGPKQKPIIKALDPILSKVVEEAKKITRYYTERLGKQTKIEQLIIVGGGSNMPGIGDYFTEHMALPSRVASPWQIINFGKLTALSRQTKPRYITAIGLSLVNSKEIWQ